MTSTSLELDGGMTYAIGSFRVREDSTPVSAADNSGGTGSMSIEFIEYEGAGELPLKSITLRDDRHGIVGGVVSGVGGDGFAARLEAETRLIALVNEVTAAPYIGTLGGALSYYLDLVGLPDDIEIDPTLAAKPVAYIGWSGLLYDKLKELSILHRMEISLVSNQIIVRPIRQRLAESSPMEEFSWDTDATNLYDSFSVANYNLREVDNEIVYPAAAGEGTSITMEANERIETRLRTNVSLISIQQPQLTQDLNEFYTGPDSLYAVVDKDGKSLSSGEWAQMGGYVEVEINPENDTEIILRARGAADWNRAPFKLALPRALDNQSAGEYPALVIHGTGVEFNREVYEVKTGVPWEHSQGRTAGTVDTIFAANRGDAWQLAASAITSYAAPTRTLRATVEYTNRLGETGIITGATYEDFEDEYPTESYSEFETEKGNETYEEFAQDYLNRTVEQFENQAFGNVAGARIRFGDMYVRIRSATIEQGGISYQAEEDTTIEEFQGVWSNDETYEDFEAFWGDKTYNDFGAAPLWH